MSKTQEILSEMARLTVLSSRLCDVQLLNLKQFPWVFFEGLTEVKIDYDLTPIKTVNDESAVSKLLVCYYLTIEESKNDNLEKRFKALEKSVRTLFWKDVTVEVYFNENIRYKSSKI